MLSKCKIPAISINNFTFIIVFRLKEVAEEPDIMGDLREEIEAFYKRDHVEVVEETDLVETMFFTDLNFTHNLRATQIRWHPSIPVFNELKTKLPFLLFRL